MRRDVLGDLFKACSLYSTLCSGQYWAFLLWKQSGFTRVLCFLVSQVYLMLGVARLSGGLDLRARIVQNRKIFQGRRNPFHLPLPSPWETRGSYSHILLYQLKKCYKGPYWCLCTTWPLSISNYISFLFVLFLIPVTSFFISVSPLDINWAPFYVMNLVRVDIEQRWYSLSSNTSEDNWTLLAAFIV